MKKAKHGQLQLSSELLRILHHDNARPIREISRLLEVSEKVVLRELISREIDIRFYKDPSRVDSSAGPTKEATSAKGRTGATIATVTDIKGKQVRIKKSQILRLIASGVTSRADIGKKLGLTVARVHYLCNRRFNITRNSTKAPQSTKTAPQTVLAEKMFS